MDCSDEAEGNFIILVDILVFSLVKLPDYIIIFQCNAVALQYMEHSSIRLAAGLQDSK